MKFQDILERVRKIPSGGNEFGVPTNQPTKTDREAVPTVKSPPLAECLYCKKSASFVGNYCSTPCRSQHVSLLARDPEKLLEHPLPSFDDIKYGSAYARSYQDFMNLKREVYDRRRRNGWEPESTRKYL